MRLNDVIDRLRSLAPEHLAESWDKVGLHIGDRRQDVRKALLCIDLTEAVMAEAVRADVQLIVAYHPPIFEPIRTLTTDDAKSRVIREAIRRNIAVYSPHTALDAAEGGVNDWLCDGIGKGKRRPIRPAQPKSAQFKLVTFVPHEHADALRSALARAGAGVIGGYTECSFNLAGEGTFRGGAGTSPTVGKAGRFERVPELRIEMVCPQSALAAVVAALRETHPYEEPAFDLYRLELPPADATVGQGRVVELDRPVSAAALVARLKRHLGVRFLECARPQAAKAIRRVGVCAGAGGSLLAEAGSVDAFVTGEMRHHDVLAAVARGQTIILAGHTQTERPYLRVYRDRLANITGRAVRWSASKADQPPSRIV